MALNKGSLICSLFLSHRGFNDAINGFSDDGWSLVNCDGAEDVVMAISSAKNLTSGLNALSLLGGVLCAKASMLLQVRSLHLLILIVVLIFSTQE